ncbi:MAG: arylamine N-acetyltransferase [Acidobacteriota bacterium]|jgi:N-hydroxyarylamine O-acetyltransferase
MQEPSLDLAAYLRRIDVSAPVAADLQSVRALHRAHRAAVPFENLDIQLGKPIRLDLDSLQAKLVGARRGGYCFEHNTLFLHALRALGFEVTPCEARVRPPGSDRITPRTHMVLIARIDGAEWLLDVGFGVSGPLEPVALSDEPQEQFGGRYRVTRQHGEHVLQTDLPVAGQGGGNAGWRDLYAFVAESRHPIDFEVANWFTSTHPESRFVVTLTVQLATPAARHVLTNLDYTRSTPDGEEVHKIERGELMGLLAERFGIELPADSRFRALDG